MVCDTRIDLSLYPMGLETAQEWGKGASVYIYGVLSSPACGVMYLENVDVRLTIDIGPVRVVDRIQNSCISSSCAGFWESIRRYSWPLTFDHTWIVPSTVLIGGIEKDTVGMPITITASFAGNVGFNSSSTTIANRVAGIMINADKTFAKPGESITFSGDWIPNKEINIYYWTKTFLGTDWKEHVVTTKTDLNGDFISVGIIPSDSSDAQGNPITGPTVLEFQACPPGLWPNECYGTSVSNKLSITISPGIPLAVAPNKYTKTFPMAQTYSGPARSESIHANASFIDLTYETKIVSLEEAIYNAQMVIETAAIQQGLTLLQSEISYTGTTLGYEFDIIYTYIKPPEALGDVRLYSTAIPLLYAALIIVGAIIVLALIFGPPEVKDLIWSAIGAAVGGIALVIGMAAAVLFILPRITPTLERITAPTSRKV